LYKTRLVTFGDSYTYGDELINPAVSAWPVLVADKFSCKLLNLAKPGFSNDAILEQILDQDLNSNDIVVVCFSHYTRLYFEDKLGWFTTITEIEQDQIFREDLSKLLIATVSDEWLFKRWLKQIIYLQEYLKSKDIKFLFTVANLNDIDVDQRYKSYTALMNQIDKKTFLGNQNQTFEDITKTLPRGEFRHPLEQAHVEFANFLIEYMIKIYNL
jgi:hypothetical protein